MLDPHYLQHIVDGAENIASQLHEYIIRQIVDRMMIRIGRGDDYLLTSSDAWRIQVLQDSGYLLQDITAELAKYTKRQEKEIKAAMEEAGVKALEYDDKIYQAAGLSPMPLTQSPALIRLMERNYNATLGEWRNMTRSTAEAAQKLFLNECDFAYNKVMSGATSYSQAVREAVEAVASGGVYVDYPSGHRDTIEVATARAVRTGIAQAAGDISINIEAAAKQNRVSWSSNGTPQILSYSGDAVALAEVDAYAVNIYSYANTTSEQRTGQVTVYLKEAPSIERKIVVIQEAAAAERMVIIDVHACGVEAGENIELVFELTTSWLGWFDVLDDLTVRVSFEELSSMMGQELADHVGERFYIEASNNGECWFGPVPASGNIEAELV